MKKLHQNRRQKTQQTAQAETEARAWKAIERGRKVSAATGEWQIGLLPKKSVSIRIEPVIIDWFKARGGKYQTLMRRVLKQYAADNAEDGIMANVRKSHA